MGLMEYLDPAQLKMAAEKGARAAWEHILYPAAKKLVEQSDTKWDDAALEVAKGLIEEVIDSISPDVG